MITFWSEFDNWGVYFELGLAKIVNLCSNLMCYAWYVITFFLWNLEFGFCVSGVLAYNVHCLLI